MTSYLTPLLFDARSLPGGALSVLLYIIAVDVLANFIDKN